MSDYLAARARIIASIRGFFEAQGFLEVETPLRIPANAPEDHIDPLHSGDWFMHTSPELCMKRLLCRGHRRIFQICRCWRRGERGSRHLPEFTMLEWYRAGSDYTALMDDCEALLAWISREAGGPADWVSGQAERLTVEQAFNRYAGKEMGSAVAEGTFDEVMATAIEPALPRHPVILMDYPAEMAALSRLKPNEPGRAERFELYAGGLELANGFSELNDSEEQRQRFLEANRHRSARGAAPLPLPEPFLAELAAMPPSAGIALGVDRLVMLVTGAERIDDVVTFTPERL